MVIFSVDLKNNLWFKEKQVTTISKDVYTCIRFWYISLLTTVYLYILDNCYLYIISEIKNIKHDGYDINKCICVCKSSI